MLNNISQYKKSFVSLPSYIWASAFDIRTNSIIIGGEECCKKINLNGEIDDMFNCNIIGTVYAINILDDNTIILGGLFRSVNGVECNNIVKLNSDGSLNSHFMCNVNYDIVNMYIDTSIPEYDLLICGGFNKINGNRMGCIARISSITGNLDESFSSFIQNNELLGIYSINTIKKTLDNCYIIGGQFSIYKDDKKIGTNLLKIDINGNIVDDFHLNIINGTVRSIYLNELQNRLYIGGEFITINTKIRNGFAILNMSGKLYKYSLQFDCPNYRIHSISGIIPTHNDTLLLTGTFTAVNDIPANQLIELNMNGDILNTINSDMMRPSIINILYMPGVLFYSCFSLENEHITLYYNSDIYNEHKQNITFRRRKFAIMARKYLLIK
jgi:hypothetical protein